MSFISTQSSNPKWVSLGVVFGGGGRRWLRGGGDDGGWVIIISYWSGNGVLVVENECEKGFEWRVGLGVVKMEMKDDDARVMEFSFAIDKEFGVF